MIQNISNSKSYLNVNESVDKNTTQKNNKVENGKFKKYLSDYVPKYTGDEGLAKKYNYKEMTIFEKRIFDHYMLISRPETTYEDFKKKSCGFPPVDAPKDIMEAYINTISKYPENQREKVMATFIPLDRPNDSLNMETILKNAIDECSLVEILSGQSQKHRKSLYQTFLDELNKINTVNK